MMIPPSATSHRPDGSLRVMIPQYPDACRRDRGIGTAIPPSRCEMRRAPPAEPFDDAAIGRVTARDGKSETVPKVPLRFR